MRPSRRLETRRIVTLSGEMTFSRVVFRCRACRTSSAPLDAELGAAPGQKFTRRVRRAICFAAANGSFADAATAMAENFALAVGHSQAAEIANKEGERIAAAAEEREEKWREGELPPEEQPNTLVLLADATSVLTRAGEDHKMITLVRGYDLGGRVTANTAAPPDDAKAPSRPMLASSRYAGTAAEQACAGGVQSDLARRIMALARRLGADGARRIVALADGNPVFWEIMAELFPDAIFIQDLWHVVEYLSEASKAAARPGEDPAQLREKWAHALKEQGGIERILGDLARATKRVRSGAKREVLRRAAGYLESGRERMDYPAFLAAELPIGSGPIEAACKHLVKERFNLAGARWSRRNCGKILALRLAIANEEWLMHWRPSGNQQLGVA